MKTQSDQFSEVALGLILAAVVVKVLFGGAVLAAMIHQGIIMVIVGAMLLGIAVACVTLKQRVHRWRHPPKPPMTAEERAARARARDERFLAQLIADREADERWLAAEERRRQRHREAGRPGNLAGIELGGRPSQGREDDTGDRGELGGQPTHHAR